MMRAIGPIGGTCGNSRPWVGTISVLWAALLVGAPGCGREYVRPAQQFSPPLQGFMVRADAYVAQRRRIAADLPPLEPSADPEQIKARARAFRAALLAARATARQGDIIDPDAAEELRRLLREVPPSTRTVIDERRPRVTPAVNAAYPDTEPIETMLPAMLERLPPLPDELQFRMVGHTLVLLDWQSRIIVDLVPDALPR
jgi:hypothetical protein